MTEPVLRGGKADGLMQIRDLDDVSVPAFVSIPADASASLRARIIQDFLKTHPNASKVAVRSSALGEDSAEMSYAGAFRTFLNVPMTQRDITGAVRAVQKHGRQKLAQVFNRAADKTMGVVVQHMVENPDFAGVCLSQGYGADDAAYLLINFRQGLGDDLVGGIDNGRTLRVLRNGPLSEEMLKRYPFVPGLLASVKSMEKHFGGRPLDIEFAAKNGAVHILQARPLVTTQPATPDIRQTAENAVHALMPQIAAIPDNDMLCDMADINPRELLGQTPHPANVALFRLMFADHIVEAARGQMGYAPLYQGLLRDIAGKPYVSLRNAAYSMRPAGISAATYDKIVGVYRAILKDDPTLQDKVEFAVFITNARQLPAFFAAYGAQLSASEKSEITNSFQSLEGVLREKTATYCQAYAAIVSDYRATLAALTSTSDEADMVAALQMGTRLFVRTARLAFYKKALCDTLYGASVTQAFLVSLGTPSEHLHKDLLRYAGGKIDQTTLATEYGHLRPGQMDMFAPSYREDLSKSLDLQRYQAMTAAEIAAEEKAFEQKKAELAQALAALPPGQRQDIEELRLLVAAREQVKHEFMRAYDLLAMRQKPRYTPDLDAKSPLLLPEVLTQDTDLSCLEVPGNRGTYFGSGRIEALPVLVTDDTLHALKATDVAGRILIMDHADPGYDFLLMFKPAAIITRVGGPASHIAIRVNEHGIPACIGCGIDLAAVDPAKTYVLDCDAKSHHAGQLAGPIPKVKNAPHTP